jgi:hypothetical protein
MARRLQTAVLTQAGEVVIAPGKDNVGLGIAETLQGIAGQLGDRLAQIFHGAVGDGESGAVAPVV